MTKRTPLCACAALTALSIGAFAQEFNVDFANDGAPLPDTYAAAGSAGRWNTVAPSFPGPGVSLVDLDGNSTAVTVSKLDFIGALSNLVDPSLPADAQNLLGDGFTTTDIPGRIVFNGLAPAQYEVLAYGFVPSQPSFKTTFLQAFPSGSAAGGTWSGAYELGVTHVRTRTFVAPGAQLRVDWTVGGPFGSFGIFSGAQIERVWKLACCGLAGTGGVPALDAQGSLEPATQVDLRLSQASANAPWWIVIGASQIDLPLAGGTLIPSLDFFAFAGTTSPAGVGIFSGNTSASLGSGLPLYAQAWVLDAGALQGVAATNGLFATTF